MIKKIILAGILLCLFIAIPLSIAGIKRVEPGVAFMAFTTSLNKHFEAWKISIPDIPDIPVYDNAEGFVLVLNVLIKIVNVITDFLNIISTLLNIIIHIIQFICTLLFEIGFMIGILIGTGSSDYQWAWSGYRPPVV